MARPPLSPEQHALLLRIGERLRQARVAAGLTQEDVGDTLGADGKYVGTVERGVVNPSATRLFEFAATLDMTVEELFVDLRAEYVPALLEED